MLAVLNPHGEITLECRLGDRSLAVKLPHGEQSILLDADVIGRFVYFTISPRIFMGTDVRELGLLFRKIAREIAPGADCRRLLPQSPAE